MGDRCLSELIQRKRNKQACSTCARQPSIFLLSLGDSENLRVTMGGMSRMVRSSQPYSAISKSMPRPLC